MTPVFYCFVFLLALVVISATGLDLAAHYGPDVAIGYLVAVGAVATLVGAIIKSGRRS